MKTPSLTIMLNCKGQIFTEPLSSPTALNNIGFILELEVKGLAEPQILGGFDFDSARRDTEKRKEASIKHP